MARVKQKSGWQRSIAKGKFPVMATFSAADKPILLEAARRAGLKPSTYVRTVALAQAYCDCGTANPKEIEQ